MSPPDRLPDRLDALLATICLIFNEGYATSYRRALDLVAAEPERLFLLRRLEELGADST